MGRRSLIPVSAISRLLSSSRAAKRRAENQKIINSQNGPKQLDPEYTILTLDFNTQTRNTKISFSKTVRYRTVERYIQQNYERYPIYSAWKSKTSTFTKSVKLTNAALEELYRNDDEFIRSFAFEIITKLPEELAPSWFLKECIDEEYKEKITEQNKLKSDAKNKLQETLKNNKIQSDKFSGTMQFKEQQKIKTEKKLLKIEQKLKKAKNHKKNILLSIISFGLYTFYGSQKRINKIETKEKQLSDQLKSIDESIQLLSSQINQIVQNDLDARKKFGDYSKEIESNIVKLNIECSQKKNSIIALPKTVNDKDENFIPLKSFSGLSYTKIIGCYVIHNVENNKYYVGQSKDVIRRLRQHFHGTEPNNVIFAQDYYTSNNKENLFEIKILPCTTKDELDRTEKTLIEDYDAFLSGYNGTNGNN